MTAQPVAEDPTAEIATSEPGSHIGAFFDLDGTLVDGFTAAAHATDRIRRRQAGIGEIMGSSRRRCDTGCAACGSSIC